MCACLSRAYLRWRSSDIYEQGSERVCEGGSVSRRYRQRGQVCEILLYRCSRRGYTHEPLSPRPPVLHWGAPVLGAGLPTQDQRNRQIAATRRTAGCSRVTTAPAMHPLVRGCPRVTAGAATASADQARGDACGAVGGDGARGGVRRHHHFPTQVAVNCILMRSSLPSTSRSPPTQPPPLPRTQNVQLLRRLHPSARAEKAPN